MTDAPISARLDDAELMRRVGHDDLEAFEVLYERLSPVALGIARQICHNPDGAEDAVQEGFLAVWRARERYDPGRGAVHTWVFQIVRFRAIDSVRRESRHDERRDNEEGAAETIPTDAADLQRAVVEADEAERLRAVLATLPVEQAQVIERAFFGGLTHSEIARDLDLPLGTVKGRMRLGYNLLRRRVAA